MTQNILQNFCSITRLVCERHHKKRRDAGRRVGGSDEELLRAARATGLTLVTYDLRTIPALLQRWAHLDETHAGVISLMNERWH